MPVSLISRDRPGRMPLPLPAGYQGPFQVSIRPLLGRAYGLMR